jgi:Domain of unknown function (DUF4179)
MYEERLEQELRDFFRAETTAQEPDFNWWDKTLSNITRQNKRNRWLGLIPKTRLAWVFLPLLLLFVGGTAYAASSVIDQFFEKLGTIGKNGLSQEMDLSQTINGVTVRLERAYADNNVVLLGYTVSGPTNYFAFSDKLTTADGQRLPDAGAMGFKPGFTGVFDNWAPAERLAVVGTFDASSLTAVSSELNLNLTVPVRDWTNPSPDAPVVGVFTFNFSVPVHPGIFVNVNQTAAAKGFSFTLRNVEISHYQTEVIFQPFTQDFQDSGANPIITLTTPSGKSVPISAGGINGDLPVYYFMGDFTGEHGEWTVTIRELDYPGDMTETTIVPESGGNVIEGKAGPSTHLSGPWVFHFKTP